MNSTGSGPQADGNKFVPNPILPNGIPAERRIFLVEVDRSVWVLEFSTCNLCWDRLGKAYPSEVPQEHIRYLIEPQPIANMIILESTLLNPSGS